MHFLEELKSSLLFIYILSEALATCVSALQLAQAKSPCSNFRKRLDHPDDRSLFKCRPLHEGV
jgi:hypothetical protein